MAWVLKANHKSCDYRPDKALILNVCATYEAYFTCLLYVPCHIFFMNIPTFMYQFLFLRQFSSHRFYLLTCGDLIEIE